MRVNVLKRQSDKMSARIGRHRLVATAAGAMIAGLGGALIAGRYNRRNPASTIAAAASTVQAQREHDRELEHFQWLRDKKVEVYFRYFTELHELE